MSSSDSEQLHRFQKSDLLFFGNLSEQNLSQYNLPRTDEFVMNTRQQKLHVRSVWPSESTSCKGVVLFLHGYAAHSNRPTLHYLSNCFSSNDFALISMDFHGHGYSEGERGLVSDPCHLIDDTLCVLLALYGLNDNDCESTSNIKQPINGLPLFIMGHSMGGGTAIAVSHLLSGADLSHPHIQTTVFSIYQDVIRKEITHHYRGTLLLCPVITLSSLPSIAIRTMLYGLTRLPPTCCIPTWIFKESTLNYLCWPSPLYRKYVEQDGYPSNPNGLSYGGNIQLGTLNSIFKLAEYVQQIVPTTSFPFIVFHDPKDATLEITGSQMLARQSTSTDKTMVEVYDGFHDLLANNIVQVSEWCVHWIEKRLV